MKDISKVIAWVIDYKPLIYRKRLDEQAYKLVSEDILKHDYLFTGDTPRVPYPVFDDFSIMDLDAMNSLDFGSLLSIAYGEDARYYSSGAYLDNDEEINVPPEQAYYQVEDIHIDMDNDRFLDYIHKFEDNHYLVVYVDEIEAKKTFFYNRARFDYEGDEENMVIKGIARFKDQQDLLDFIEYLNTELINKPTLYLPKEDIKPGQYALFLTF